MKTRAMICRAVMLAVLVLLLAACAPGISEPTAAPEEERVIPESELLEPGKLIIATDGGLRPWSFLDENGELVGYEIDVCGALAERLGLQPEWITVDWAGTLPGIAADRFDMACSGVGITPERLTTPDFSLSIGSVQGGGAVVMRADDERVIESWEDLKGLTMGGNRGAWYPLWVQERLEGDVELVEYTNESEVFLDLKNGRTDFAGSSTLSLPVAIEEYGLKQVLSTYRPTPYGVAMRNEAPTLLREVNDAFVEWREDGTLEEWHTKWFGAPRLVGGEEISE